MAAEKQMEDRAKQQGKLTIFASYFSGAGKSYAMLKAAERAKEAGVDVVIGLSPSEQWPETRELVALFEKIPGKTERPDGRTDDEINLDACLKRLPQLMGKIPAIGNAIRT